MRSRRGVDFGARNLMKRVSILLGACLSAIILSACGGTRPLSGASSVPAIARDGVAPSVETKRFDFTGGPESYTVPAGVHALRFLLYAGRGAGDTRGAPGGAVDATIKVQPGEELGIFVGGRGHAHGPVCRASLDGSRASPEGKCNPVKGGKGGWNGGGNGGDRLPGGEIGSHVGYGGGGASDVRRGGPAGKLDQRLIVAGGGGGQSGSGWKGGDGGPLTGARGDSEYDREGGGHGGAQTHGGAGGKFGTNQGGFGVAGHGGDGQASETAKRLWGGGGGGGGWFGGGGGTGNNADPDHRFRIDGAGGGGSSYAEPGACGVHMIRGPEDNDDGYIIVAKALCDPH